MARKIIVIGEGDKPTGENMKKCVAKLLVRRQLCDWVEENRTVRRRKIKAVTTTIFSRAHTAIARRTYIPDRLPPLEPNGCKFVGPVTELGKDPVVRWMTAQTGKQRPRRFRMEAAALKRQATRMTA